MPSKKTNSENFGSSRFRAFNSSKRIVLVVDDGGIPFDKSNGTSNPIPFDAYQRILELAEKFNLIIPIAVIADFIDVDGISSNYRLINKDAERIIAFLKKNAFRLPVWNHGLTHSYKNHETEFFIYGAQETVPESFQREHFEMSQTIFKNVGLKPPEVFVPPGHAWEPGVTDRIAKEFGIKTIAIREFEKRELRSWLKTPRSPYKMKWKRSLHLRSIYRLGLGITSTKRHFSNFDVVKTQAYIWPQNILLHFLIHRNIRLTQKTDHFFAHIQNFSDSNAMWFWDKIFSYLVCQLS